MIYHLALPEAWEKALRKGVYTHPSLQAEGFIHCSTEDQLGPTAYRHFPAESELVILYLVDKRFKNILKWEPASNGELYPHIYGEIPLEYVETTRTLLRNPEGEWEWEL